LKNLIKYILQQILGYEKYLYLFSKFKISTLKSDSKEKDFFIFLDMIPNGSTVLDIGANIGIMTYFLSKKARTISFEPIPSNYKVLTKIIDNYSLSNVEPFELALSNENKEMTMILPVVGSAKMQGLSHMKHDSITEFNEGIEVSVSCVMLDDFVESHSIDGISGIKIDVENFEYYVLKGGFKSIQNFRPIIYIELWDNENRQKCFELFKELNYNICIVERGKTILYKPEVHFKQNFIILPK